ncbi:MAG TPA: nucleotidyltransferase family protein [Chryseolinea sp.]
MSKKENPASSNHHVAIVILAAGSSSRMGQSKQLLPVHDTTVLRQAITVALHARPAVVTVVLGAHAKLHRESIQFMPVKIVVNEQWETGMGSSLKAGLQYVEAHYPQVTAVLFMVCDQPALTTQHLLNLIQEAGKPIVASHYAGSPGVPALFNKPYFPALNALGNDQGAKRIFQQFPEQVSLVNFPGGDLDLDTMEDYQNYLNRK